MVYAVLLENFPMKKLCLSLLFSAVTIICLSQQDTSLVNRLNKTLQFTKTMDLDKIMDYTYPKLFTIVTRGQMVEALKSSFETDEFRIELDSVELDTIFPIFKIDNGHYAKIKHTMLMRMKYKEPLDTFDKDKSQMTALMAVKFGEDNVRFDRLTNSLNIFMRSNMVAVKDNYSPQWTFVTLDADNPALLNLLFSKEVLDKLKEFK